jgi:hypothetical protein
MQSKAATADDRRDLGTERDMGRSIAAICELQKTRSGEVKQRKIHKAVASVVRCRLIF